jgi:hypothetical protein
MMVEGFSTAGSRQFTQKAQAVIAVGAAGLAVATKIHAVSNPRLDSRLEIGERIVLDCPEC